MAAMGASIHSLKEALSFLPWHSTTAQQTALRTTRRNGDWRSLFSLFSEQILSASVSPALQALLPVATSSFFTRPATMLAILHCTPLGRPRPLFIVVALGSRRSRGTNTLSRFSSSEMNAPRCRYPPPETPFLFLSRLRYSCELRSVARPLPFRIVSSTPPEWRNPIFGVLFCFLSEEAARRWCASSHHFARPSRPRPSPRRRP